MPIKARSRKRRRAIARPRSEGRLRLQLEAVQRDLDTCTQRVQKLEKLTEDLRADLDRLREKVRS